MDVENEVYYYSSDSEPEYEPVYDPIGFRELLEYKGYFLPCSALNGTHFPIPVYEYTNYCTSIILFL